ncbi:hypothetical protein A9995_06915 [Erythrobacter sp. QSSC1-22B]|uniref:hypothetical protein n=1 Tax=Erythrobacter sp. QSSC1-22B TaxID=1860125 RepID=UPI0008051ED0|nr:hypothetical protein [Erythrobacter sp. QSSC1-22B]OBX19478.1 hypothetical protein A9995_06915 [Erythrobacter sp. QSSC1-22B]
MQSQFEVTDIKCKASSATGYGIRGKRRGSEVVVLLGANEEWFAFAYLAKKEQSPARLSDTELGGLVDSLEQAFLVPS